MVEKICLPSVAFLSAGGLAGLLGVRASGHTQQCERQGGQERNW